MDKAHNVEKVSFRGRTMLLRVDGKDYEADLSVQSQRLASSTSEQLKNFVVSPSGYGIHWPDVDEDLSVDGLIGGTHDSPFDANAPEKSRKGYMDAPAQ